MRYKKGSGLVSVLRRAQGESGVIVENAHHMTYWPILMVKDAHHMKNDLEPRPPHEKCPNLEKTGNKFVYRCRNSVYRKGKWFIYGKRPIK